MAHDRRDARGRELLAEGRHEAALSLRDDARELLVGASLYGRIHEARDARHGRRLRPVAEAAPAVAARAVHHVEGLPRPHLGHRAALGLLVALGQLVIARLPLTQLTRGRLATARRSRSREAEQQDGPDAEGVW